MDIARTISGNGAAGSSRAKITIAKVLKDPESATEMRQSDRHRPAWTQRISARQAA